MDCNTMKDKLYIGIVGPIGSGKGVMSIYLMRRFGFTSFSLSSIVHEELQKRGQSTVTRKLLQDVGDDLRKKHGRDILAKKAVEILNHNGIKKVLIDGIRNPGEVAFLLTLSHFILIAVSAKRTIRFKRVMKRKKPWDPKTWKDFLAVDQRDSGLHQNSTGQQVDETIRMAHHAITNNASLDEFYKKIEATFKKIIMQ